MDMYGCSRNVVLGVTDDVSADRSSRMNFEVYRAMFSAKHYTLIEGCFKVSMNNDSNFNANTTHEFYEGSGQVTDMTSTFQLLKTKLKKSHK